MSIKKWRAVNKKGSIKLFWRERKNIFNEGRKRGGQLLKLENTT
jgi:hypothetical protein